MIQICLEISYTQVFREISFIDVFTGKEMSALKFPSVKPRESPRHLQGNPMGRLYSPIELSPPAASIPRFFKNETFTEKSTTEVPLSIDSKTEKQIRLAVVNALEHYMYRFRRSFWPNDYMLIALTMKICY